MKNKFLATTLIALLFSSVSSAGWGDFFGCGGFFANFSQTNRALRRSLKINEKGIETIKLGTSGDLLSFLKKYGREITSTDTKHLLDAAARNLDLEKFNILLKTEKFDYEVYLFSEGRSYPIRKYDLDEPTELVIGQYFYNELPENQKQVYLKMQNLADAYNSKLLTKRAEIAKAKKEKFELELNQRLQRAKERFITRTIDATQIKNQEALMQYAMQLIYTGKAEDLETLIKTYPDFKLTQATYSNMSLLYASFSQRCLECFKVVRYNGGTLNAMKAIHLQKNHEYDIPTKVQHALISKEPEYNKIYLE